MREERKGTGRRWGRPGEREGEDPGGSARRERERGDPWGGGGGAWNRSQQQLSV